MGEKHNQPFQLSFNPSLKVDFQGSRVTSDSGLLLVRELDERLGWSTLIIENIMGDRRGKNTQLPLPALLRQSIYSISSTILWGESIASALALSSRLIRPSPARFSSWLSTSVSNQCSREGNAAPRSQIFSESIKQMISKLMVQAGHDPKSTSPAAAGRRHE